MSLDPINDSRLTFDKADRIRRALRISGVGVQELAEQLEVSRGSVGNWINGHAEPRPRDLRQIALRTGFPYDWLDRGVEPTELDPDGGTVTHRYHKPVALLLAA